MDLKRTIFLIAVILCFLVPTSFSAETQQVKEAKSTLISNLENNRTQVVVAYGTSLTSHGAWVKEVGEILEKAFPELVTVINSGGSGRWSQWGLDNLEERVIQKKPDTVFIEFSMNDSVERFRCSVEQSQANLETMISRIRKSNPKCEIILMTMTPGNGNPVKRVNIAEYYQAYREVAAKHQFLLIDHYPTWIDLQKADKSLFDKYVPDSVHATAKGCAKIITPAIVEALGLHADKISAMPISQVNLVAEVSPRTPALLCADQSDNRIRLIDPLAPGDRNPNLWSYPAVDAAPSEYVPTDAKRVERDGVVYLLASYHGRVQLVRFEDRKLVQDFPAYGSCHSAELLPDGAIVTANSNHGQLRLHHTADDFVDLKLPRAHGVAWDRERQCLWALGDCLYRIDYAERKLTIKKKFELPLSATGHDLFPLRHEAKLLVSNNSALFLFDIATETFETVSELSGIKSASQHQDGTIWITDPAKLAGAAQWQSDAVLCVRPSEPAFRYRHEGAKFYKARWWQKVSFSY